MTTCPHPPPPLLAGDLKKRLTRLARDDPGLLDGETMIRMIRGHALAEFGQS